MIRYRILKELLKVGRNTRAIENRSGEFRIIPVMHIVTMSGAFDKEPTRIRAHRLESRLYFVDLLGSAEVLERYSPIKPVINRAAVITRQPDPPNRGADHNAKKRGRAAVRDVSQRSDQPFHFVPSDISATTISVNEVALV